jgi:arsenate reductase (glutaredoxin)
MKATIWHNPACGTSRKALAILEEASDVDVTVIEYLKTPYSRDKLVQLFRDAGLSPRDALRKMGTDAEEKGLPDASDDAILDAMAANSAYVNRPFVETDKGVALCRPQDKVHDLL